MIVAIVVGDDTLKNSFAGDDEQHPPAMRILRGVVRHV